MQSGRHAVVFILACIAVGVCVGIVLAYATPLHVPPPVTSTPAFSEPAPIVRPIIVAVGNPPTTTATTAPTTVKAMPKKVEVPTCDQPKDPDDNPNLWLIPVGPDHSIGDYVPSGLVSLDTYVPTTMPTICLTETAATALKSMFSAMHAENLYPMIASGYRSADYQGTLYEGTNVITNGYSSVAEPEHSEHQLGMAVDFIGIPDSTNTDYSALNDFGNTLDYAWLVKNAASYGFVQSYQVGKEAITGYIPEPWHWRYVGTTNAEAIVSSGLAPYQYLQNLAKQP